MESSLSPEQLFVFRLLTGVSPPVINVTNNAKAMPSTSQVNHSAPPSPSQLTDGATPSPSQGTHSAAPSPLQGTHGAAPSPSQGAHGAAPSSPQLTHSAAPSQVSHVASTLHGQTILLKVINPAKKREYKVFQIDVLTSVDSEKELRKAIFDKVE